MNRNAGWMLGIGAGLLIGSMAGAMLPTNRSAMKTQVGKSIEKLGVAVDRAVNNIIDEMH